MTFVTWKWKPPSRYRSVFGPETVNAWRRMIARHYPDPHRCLCVTDDPKGIDPEVEIIPAWNDFKDLPAPMGKRNPSCYRRLRMFTSGIGEVFGPRFFSMDLDIVITGDLRPIVNRPEDFVIWADTNPNTFYNGSLVLMNAGARPQVWNKFDPNQSPALAKAARHFGSDQGWISYCLGPKEAKFTTADGVYSFKNHLQASGPLPANARIVSFHGEFDPWGRLAQRLPWVREHYGVVGSREAVSA